MPNKNRYVVFFGVAAAHLALIAALLGLSRAVSLPFSVGIPITALLIFRPAAHPPAPMARPRLGQAPAFLAPIPEPLAPATPALPVSRRSSEIDWNAAAREAAAAVLERKRPLSFGFPPGGQSALTLGVPSAYSPAHYAGESERTATGELIEWTSDRCYVASDPPTLAEPDFLKNARTTHFGCVPPAGPAPGELFKGLPAYKKYRPH
jgi:hypothetical protein